MSNIYNNLIYFTDNIVNFIATKNMGLYRITHNFWGVPKINHKA